MPSLPSVSDVKTYLGLTGTGDDSLILERIAAAVSMAERDTGRVFASSSNVTRVYSTNQQALVQIHDRPYTDASRVVTWLGATLREGTNCWFLPDRRNPDISTTLQIRYFDTTNPYWYKVDPFWFDKNLDNGRMFGSGAPNDLSITGIIGQPFPSADVTGAITVLTSFLYWRAKSGATGVAYTTTGESVSLAETPPEYQQFVADWRIRTQVGLGG